MQKLPLWQIWIQFTGIGEESFLWSTMGNNFLVCLKNVWAFQCLASLCKYSYILFDQGIAVGKDLWFRHQTLVNIAQGTWNLPGFPI